MTEPSYAHLDPHQRRICLAIGLACIAMGLSQQILLWQLDPSGLSPAAKRLPYWDFTNLWAGSVVALRGDVGLLFDPDGYMQALNAMFGGVLTDAQEWSYPPHILLIGAPLALMPIWLAYAVWSAGTLALFHLALKPFRLPMLAHLFVLASPAIWSNQVFGQNGALTAALLLGGLLLAPRRPVLAGLLIGLLTIKPHLGLLLPFCLLASGNFRALISASLTALLLFAVTGLLFGFEVWSGFLGVTRPLMTLIMEAPYPQAYHTHMATFFVTVRSLGGGLEFAYAVQGLATLLAIAAVCWLWRPGSRIDHRSRVAITGALVIAATPYGYTHDTAPLYLAIAWFLLTEKRPAVALYGAAWLFALLFPALHVTGVSFGIVGPALLSAYMFVRHGMGATADQSSGEDVPAPTRSRRAKMVVAGSR